MNPTRLAGRRRALALLGATPLLLDGDSGLLRFGCCGLGGERAGQQQAGEKRLVGHELVPCWAGA